MKTLTIKLSKHILSREEGDHILLYNYKNDAVLKISPELHQTFLAGEIQDTDDFRTALKILYKNGMLDDKSKNGEFQNEITSAVGTLSNLFDLKSLYNPFTVLWAITSSCNLKCIYCFPDVQSVQPTFISLPMEKLNRIADQLVEAKIFQLTITGGEAFLEKNIWKIIEKIRKNNIKVVVVSNGTTINKEIVQKVKQFEVIVAVSLDAYNEEINAKTRGKAVFKKIIDGINQLKNANIQVVVLITLTRFNFPYLKELIALVHEKLGIMHVTLQDLKHFGTKADYENLRLTIDQEKALYDQVSHLRQKYPKLFFNVTELFIFPREEYKKVKNDKIMQCPAGNNMAYIDFYGDMYPCTNLPMMKLGNVVFGKGITELWRNSKIMRRLRLLKEESLCHISGCDGCSFHDYCDGGCRGDAILSGNGLYGRASRCPKSLGVDHITL